MVQSGQDDPAEQQLTHAPDAPQKRQQANVQLRAKNRLVKTAEKPAGYGSKMTPHFYTKNIGVITHKTPNLSTESAVKFLASAGVP